MNVPNILTVFRIVLVGVFGVLFYYKHFVASLVVFIVAGITDVLDGYIARKYDLITDFGKLMDPLADKLMVITALGCLTFAKMLPPFFVGFVVVREVVSISIAAKLYRNNVVVYAQLFGKLSTLLFTLGICLTFIQQYTSNAHIFVLIGAIICSIVAGWQYTQTFIKGNIYKKESKQNNKLN